MWMEEGKSVDGEECGERCPRMFFHTPMWNKARKLYRGRRVGRRPHRLSASRRVIAAAVRTAVLPSPGQRETTNLSSLTRLSPRHLHNPPQYHLRAEGHICLITHTFLSRVLRVHASHITSVASIHIIPSSHPPTCLFFFRCSVVVSHQCSRYRLRTDVPFVSDI